MSTNYPHRDDDTLQSASDPFVEAMDLSKRPVINGEKGGQWGWAGNIFEYVSSQPHIEQQAWCVTLSTPGAFSKLPAGMALHSLCKAFFENRTVSFDGLREQTQVSFGEIKWDGTTLSVPSGSTRSLGNPTHVVNDVEGESFTKMIDVWVRWLMMDPKLQAPKIVTLDDPGDMLIDDISAACIYWTPTRNMRDIAHAQLVVGMMPRETVAIELRRNKEDEGQIRVINTEFTGAVEHDTYAVKEIARAMLAQMPLYNPDAIEAPDGFKERTSILKSLTDSGTIERMQQQEATTVSETYLG